jgi:glycosyltransferase involved in cell wall biosynthesis
VPPPGYGGIEFVVALLSDALVDRGHEVELFCTPGSSSTANVHPLLEAPHPEKIERALFEADHVACAFAAIDSAARAGRPFDVLHDHCGYTTLAMADRISAPVVHTVHGPFDHDTTPYYQRHGRKGRLVCKIHSTRPPVVPSPRRQRAGCEIRESFSFRVAAPAPRRSVQGAEEAGSGA